MTQRTIADQLETSCWAVANITRICLFMVSVCISTVHDMFAPILVIHHLLISVVAPMWPFYSCNNHVALLYMVGMWLLKGNDEFWIPILLAAKNQYTSPFLEYQSIVTWYTNFKYCLSNHGNLKWKKRYLVGRNDINICVPYLSTMYKRFVIHLFIEKRDFPNNTFAVAVGTLLKVIAFAAFSEALRQRR